MKTKKIVGSNPITFSFVFVNQKKGEKIMKPKNLIKALFIFGAVSNTVYVWSESILDFAKYKYYKSALGYSRPDHWMLTSYRKEGKMRLSRTLVLAFKNIKEAVSWIEGSDKA